MSFRAASRCRHCCRSSAAAHAGPSRPISTLRPLHRQATEWVSTPASTTRPRETYVERFPSSYPAPLAQYVLPSKISPDQVVLSADDFLPKPSPSTLRMLELLLTRLPEWSGSPRVRTKLRAYGLVDLQINNVLNDWNAFVFDQLGGVATEAEAKVALEQFGWDEQSLLQSFEGDEVVEATPIESAFTRKLLDFAKTHRTLPPTLRDHLQTILDVTDMSTLPFQLENIDARKMKRHFHLHIGPTNSGKTYNALKALSKAGTGAYAGPLRLLAHEVWERLNLGTVGDLNGKGRPCNLLTGEERRIVDPAAGLSSCTVEMLPLNGLRNPYDVVVIDEIQMLGDTDRGGAWTSALLGVRAKEIHLCGDETTVALLSKLIPSLGDEMTINLYERLTPLAVADRSLDGDWNNIETGDCVVTFSRRNIFAVKKAIESTLGKKCAVIYGALPPETRADQAREFNEEGGRCEVLVASDAVGMGLNLKIKRIIFESLVKFNGRSEVPLPLTQIKQIAGRAGRFGMDRENVKEEGAAEDDDVKYSNQAWRGNDVDAPPGVQKRARAKAAVKKEDVFEPDIRPASGGQVLTLHDIDLPILRDLLPVPLPLIKRATIDVPLAVSSELAVLLPRSTTYAALLDHVASLVKVPGYTVATHSANKLKQAEVLEPFRNMLSLSELALFCNAPISVRDHIALAAFRDMVQDYGSKGVVELESVMAPNRMLRTLDITEATLATLPPLPPTIGIGRRVLTPPVVVSSIPVLETLHKTLVLYIWLSFRLPIAFPDRVAAVSHKARTEAVLEECLQRMPGLRNKFSHERGKEIDREVADWRKKYVNPNGTKKMHDGATVVRKGIPWVQEAIVQRLKSRQMWRQVGVHVSERQKRLDQLDPTKDKAAKEGEEGQEVAAKNGKNEADDVEDGVEAEDAYAYAYEQDEEKGSEDDQERGRYARG